MEPLSALSVATSLVQFIDFWTCLLSEVGQPYRSPSGQDSVQVGLSTIAYDLSLLVDAVDAEMGRLAAARPPAGSSEDSFLRLCQQCSSSAKELSEAVRKLAAGGINRLFTFAQTLQSSVELSPRRKSTRIVPKDGNLFSIAIQSAASLNVYRWRGLLSDMRICTILAVKDVLWEQSHRQRQDLGRASIHQAAILTSLSQLESDTRTLNQSLIKALNADPFDLHVAEREIIDSIWSAADLSSKPIVDPTMNSAQDESSDLMDLDQYTANLAAKIRAQAKETESQTYVKMIINSLRFQGVKHREDAIPEAYEKTFQWLYEEDRQSSSHDKPWIGFTPWLENSAEDPYWVTGNAGAGKSTLVKYLTTNPKTRTHLLQWAQNRPLILASFYFWSAGVSQLQKSQTGLLRTLLLQCLEQLPSICPRVCPRRWALFKIFGSKAAQFTPQWSWGELLECFSALTPLAGREFNLALFIDGLDEFDGDHQKLIEFIKLFHRRSGIKILVSSRPENVFMDAFAANPSLKMEDFTTNDLENFVRSEFNRTTGYYELMQANPAQAAQLHKDIVQKAEGVFLWVSVVVLALCEGIKEGDGLKECLTFLGTLPSDLFTLYMIIWDRIKPEYEAEFSNIFQIHNCSTTLLDVTTLHLAEMDTDEALRQDISDLTGPLRPQIMQAMKKRLNSRTRGLLELSKEGQVDYLHRSVREWAVENWFGICCRAKKTFDPHLAILQGLAVEVVNPAIWQNAAAMNLPTEFWRRACICLYHASNVRDDSINEAPLEKIMDRLDINLGQVSISYPLSNGRLPLYRDVTQDSLMSSTGQILPHWSTTQYTMTPDRQNNTFIGLAAQFAVLPYIRKRLADNRKLLKEDASNLPILSCAVLGFEHFCRPDVADLAGKYLDASTLDSRYRLVELLVDKGALAAQIKKAKQNHPTSPYLSDTPQGGDGIHVEVNKKLQFMRSVKDVEPRELQFWEDVAALFVRHMTNEINHTRSKRLSLSRVLHGFIGKAR